MDWRGEGAGGGMGRIAAAADARPADSPGRPVRRKAWAARCDARPPHLAAVVAAAGAPGQAPTYPAPRLCIADVIAGRRQTVVARSSDRITSPSRKAVRLWNI